MSALTKLADKVKGFFGGGLEGSWRGPFFGVGHLGNSFQIENIGDGWQRGLQIPYHDASRVAIVYSCVQAYSRAVSTCEINHYRVENGKHIKQTNTWAARLCRNPNDYESWNQYIFNVIAELGFRGASLSVIVRDNSNRPIALHRIPYGNWSLFVEPETKAIFYQISADGNSLTPNPEQNYLAPARDVIHFRQHCPRHPLIGESPVAAAALAVGVNVALSQSQAAFFAQMRRPSGILSTEQSLNKDQIMRLREAFDEQAKRWAQGGMPILSNGLKFQGMSISSQDAQLIDAQKMSLDDVCRVFAIPPPVVAILNNATFSNTESLINFWLSTGLGSLLMNLEQSLWKSLGMGTDEYLDFDTDGLLRSDAKARVEMLTRGITGGLFSPNEARAREWLPDVEGGDTVFLQQQNFPIDLLKQYAQNTVSGQMAQQSAPAATDSPTPTNDNADGVDAADQASSDKQLELDDKTLRDDIVLRLDGAAIYENDITDFEMVQLRSQLNKQINTLH